jgi:gas vesicle protein
MTRPGRFVFGAILGLVLGYALVLLLAPGLRSRRDRGDFHTIYQAPSDNSGQRTPAP